MRVKVTTEQPDLSDAIRRSIAEADPALTSMLEAIGARGAEIAVTRSPSRTGHFATTIGYEVNDDGVWVGSKARHAHIIERGRRAGTIANVAVIGRAFGLDHPEAYTVARAIGRKGTPGAHTFEHTRDAMAADVQVEAVDYLTRIELTKRSA